MRRRLFVLVFAGALATSLTSIAPSASAEPPPALSAMPPPPFSMRSVDALTRAAIDRQRARLLPLVRPALRQKIATAARLLLQRISEPPPENAKPLDTFQNARKIVIDGASFNTTGYSAVDIETLVFLVMLEASKDAEDDLKNEIAAMEAINAAKQCLREARNDKVKAKRCIAALQPTATMTKAQLDALRDRIEGSLDSMSEMGETESLRLQMAMDRLSKMMTALSNVLKKISDTSGAVVQNLK